MPRNSHLPKIERGNFPRMRCPHCQAPAIARTSVSIVAIYREITYQCQRAECSFSWVAGLGAVRSLSPSGQPNPDVSIPYTTHPNLTRPPRVDHDH